MVIESVELVALPNAPTWQEKVYRAHLDSGEDIDLFQNLWDVPISPNPLWDSRPKRPEKSVPRKYWPLCEAVTEPRRIPALLVKWHPRTEYVSSPPEFAHRDSALPVLQQHPALH